MQIQSHPSCDSPDREWSSLPKTSAMRISIVTPTYNRAHLLEAALLSVLAQGWSDTEHIVVDGMSSDGTVELLARYPHLRVIREPDSGLYEALNKGIRAATGEVIGHLNSDDEYLPGHLRVSPQNSPILRSKPSPEGQRFWAKTMRYVNGS